MWSRMQWKNLFFYIWNEVFSTRKWPVFRENTSFQTLTSRGFILLHGSAQIFVLETSSSRIQWFNLPLFMITLEKWTPIESAMAFWIITLLFHELNEQKYLNQYKCVLQGLHFLELIHDCLDLQSIPVSEKKNIMNDIHISLPPPCWKDELRLNPWIITSFPLAPSTNENKYLNRNQECT